MQIKDILQEKLNPKNANSQTNKQETKQNQLFLEGVTNE